MTAGARLRWLAVRGLQRRKDGREADIGDANARRQPIARTRRRRSATAIEPRRAVLPHREESSDYGRSSRGP
jgi:hypothetical protein